MRLTSTREPIRLIDEVLRSARERGVRVWLEQGQLQYRAPRGALSEEELQQLRARRDQIVAYLERDTTSADQDHGPTPRPPDLRSAPLSFAQLAHWNSERLSERPSIRQVASATRIQGALSVDALRASVAEIFCRHEALRTRIVIQNGTPMQQVDASAGELSAVVDLASVANDLRQAEVTRIVRNLILEPINLAVGPLAEMKVLRLSDDEHVLVIVMDHLISDGMSVGILLRDLLTAYHQAIEGRPTYLPKVAAQMADYALWQRKTEDHWVRRHAAFWRERLAGSARVQFPTDRTRIVPEKIHWATVPVRIGRGVRAQLSEWSRLRGTTLAMTVFTAYAALTLRWCDAFHIVIRYVTTGRARPEIENTVGYFASTLFLRIELRADDTFLDLMRRITAEYCAAHEHADLSWLDAQSPKPEFMRNTFFNWIPQRPSVAASFGQSTHAVSCSQLIFKHPAIHIFDKDEEPALQLLDAGDEVTGSLYFPTDRLFASTLERFGRDFLSFMHAMLKDPEQRVMDVALSLPSRRRTM